MIGEYLLNLDSIRFDSISMSFKSVSPNEYFYVVMCSAIDLDGSCVCKVCNIVFTLKSILTCFYLKRIVLFNINK